MQTGIETKKVASNGRRTGRRGNPCTSILLWGRRHSCSHCKTFAGMKHGMKHTMKHSMKHGYETEGYATNEEKV